ncbi:MAG: Unknown protein [uncultured Sulfurovum sp.]|uniref:Uncharacterized protein n=1 Tax=uncultured Sulfurovum sp. TaxID=269237 RepID=A0A6S6T711_9BACT|nr:MAG: Unknown protein [uncultured Sulfurovum sp.]
MENFEKLNYILGKHMKATDVTLAFGFKSETMLSKMRNGNSNINQLHIDGLEKYFDIPTKLFSSHIRTKTQVDALIKSHRLEKKKALIRENHQKNTLVQLEEEGLIPHGIFDNHNEEEVERLIKKYKKKLATYSTTPPYIKHSKKVFQTNDKLFKKLQGVWYAYFYPSNPSSVPDAIWEVKTTINEDYSVIDYWDNKGFLQLGKQESMIIKESYDNNDLTFIRFANRQVPSQHFRFVIVSNQNNTDREMINFGFYSRQQYSSKEAKEILGDISTAQLKLNLAFNDRLNERAIVPK